MPDPSARPVIVWTDDRSAPAAARLLEAMGTAVRTVGVGGPRSAPVHALAKQHGLETDDDLRGMIVRHAGAWVLLASGRDAAADALAHAAEKGSVVVALEPAVSEWDDLPVLVRLAGRVVCVPAFMACPGWVSAADPSELLGTPRVLTFHSAGPAEEGTVYARLFDAWRTLLRFTDQPETIDASIAHGDAATDDPRAVTGHLSAHARLPSGSALIRVSDSAHPRGRRLHVYGDGGNLTVDDTSYDLTDAAGKSVDSSPPAADIPSHAELAAIQWRHLLDQPPTGTTGTDEFDELRRTLACCLATLLSARTRQPESPSLLMSMR